MIGREVLDQHEGHSCVRRHGGEETFESFKAASRGTDANGQEHVCIIGFVPPSSSEDWGRVSGLFWCYPHKFHNLNLQRI